MVRHDAMIQQKKEDLTKMGVHKKYYLEADCRLHCKNPMCQKVRTITGGA